MLRESARKKFKPLVLPYGWREVRAVSVEDFRWLGINNLSLLSRDFEREIRALDVVTASHDKMNQKYHMEYYKKGAEDSRKRWMELSKSESVVLEAMKGAVEKPLLPRHRALRHFEGCNEAYVWLVADFLPSMKHDGYYKLRVTNPLCEDDHVAVMLPKSHGFEHVIYVPINSIAIVKPEELQYLSYDIAYASYLVSFFGYEDYICQEYFQDLMSFQGKLRPPCGFTDPEPIPECFAT